MNSIVSVKGLYKTFGGSPVLSNINMEVSSGEFVVIFGPNGAGKTTLIKTIATLTEPTKGTVSIEGREVHKHSVDVRRSIGLVSHDTFLYDSLTAEENLLFYGRMFEVDEDLLKSRVNQLISDSGLDMRMRDRVATFSKGMKQRLSIARALIHSPPVLLLDEPYSGLDPEATEIFNDLVIRDENIKVKVMASHNIENGFKLCTRAVIIQNGKIVFDRQKADICDVEEFELIYREILGF
ncbi:ABC transporter related protein [Methanosalsum zhilinae DSM 4017]|uniref:ABC transporter related protein n=1 Tax=Methanosalsum zhilinae (strain DSM 4017 / NBRC 107636 / OCM 62 / WeN5) TaxID=679901 RepID=F7XQ28_METZD|nr:ABC transporter ATP-binding protein [Methanosalsum zhilinae]AEH60389.1 ABC transporter related protein [Methanosalsum zhilinae DSM 4017]